MFRDVFCECMFWFALAMASAMCLWEFVAWLNQKERERDAGERPANLEAEEWENLTEEERAQLKRYFK